MFAANFFRANYFLSLFFAGVPPIPLSEHAETVTFSKGVGISVNSKANVMVRSNYGRNLVSHSK